LEHGKGFSQYYISGRDFAAISLEIVLVTHIILKHELFSIQQAVLGGFKISALMFDYVEKQLMAYPKIFLRLEWYNRANDLDDSSTFVPLVHPFT
jgi:hypothetical protein